MRQTLIFDADDTLWENNIYFEEAIARFISYLNHSTLTPAEVRATLNEIEATRGYGATQFALSLQEAYKRLAERDVSDDDLAHLEALGEQILQHPMQVMPEVRTTLDALGPRHDLYLLTKGDPDEQKLKIENSGLETYFREALIVREKDAATYRSLIESRRLDPSQTWMIGNSPRSDINPALAAGLNAVFIPHEHTWVLEKQEVQPTGTGRLLTLQRFAELRDHF